jgi:thiosulfate/3-mercaptopyruvate sulfurtransferase
MKLAPSPDRLKPSTMSHHGHLLSPKTRHLKSVIFFIATSFACSTALAQVREVQQPLASNAFSASSSAKSNPQIASKGQESKSANPHVLKPLISAEELEKQLEQPLLRVLDIRSPQAYFTAHIPGALNAPYGGWRGPASNPGELPSIEKLTTLIQSLGITPAHHIVVTSHGDDPTDFGSAARVYWTLKVLGLEKLSILNGGMKSWNQAELPTDPGSASVAKSQFRPRINHAMLAGRDEIAALIGKPQAKLIDARPAAFFMGETRHGAALQAGTLKGASNIEHDRWFAEGSARFGSEQQARSILAASGIDTNATVVSFCNTGHWAATNWFALSEVLGQKQVKLYPGSMVEWTQQSEALPMDNVPNRLKALLIDAKLWVDKNL